MSFGETLRAAREARGLTASQLAASTRLLVQIVEGLENENFKRIPAAIYGRGFVKMYCETVGLDPRPMVAEFSELYERHRNAPDKVTPPPKPQKAAAVPAPAAPPPPPPPPPPAAEPAPAAPPPPPPPPPPAPRAEPAAPAPTPPPRRSYGELFEQSYAQEEEKQGPSAVDKFRSTMSNVSSGVFANVRKLPPNTGRIATVAVGAAIIVALLAWGMSILYRATTPDARDAEETGRPAQRQQPDKAAAANPPAQPKPASPAAGKPQPKPPRSGDLRVSGIVIPPLYVD